MYFNTCFFTRSSLWPNRFKLNYFSPNSVCAEMSAKPGWRFASRPVTFPFADSSQIEDTAATRRRLFQWSLSNQTVGAGRMAQKNVDDAEAAPLFSNGEPFFDTAHQGW
jgi:hypothetical protein